MFATGCGAKWGSPQALPGAPVYFGSVVIGETDGKTNKFMPVVRDNAGSFVPSLDLQLAKCEDPKLGEPLLRGAQTDRNPSPSTVVDREGWSYIRFLPPSDSFPTYRYADIIRGNIPEVTFAGKIVLVGFELPGVDVHTLPDLRKMWGVEVHAHILNTLLQKNPVGELDLVWQAMLIVALVVLIAIVSYAFRFKSIKRFTLLLSVGLGFIVCVLIFFRLSGNIVNVSYPLFGMFLAARCVSLLTTKRVSGEELHQQFREITGKAEHILSHGSSVTEKLDEMNRSEISVLLDEIWDYKANYDDLRRQIAEYGPAAPLFHRKRLKDMSNVLQNRLQKLRELSEATGIKTPGFDSIEDIVKEGIKS